MIPIAAVPTTLITGFFGVGKTTTLRSLIERKPESETWAVLVNEFGEVGVDGALLDPLSGNGVQVREIAGGCLCCSANVPMRVAVMEILSRLRPDRLLVEPTGIGHPAGLIDELRDAELAAAIELRAVICIVDPRFVQDKRIQQAEVFWDQVAAADVLVAGKADLASEAELDRFREWAGALFPPKTHIAAAARGEINFGFLDLEFGGRAVGGVQGHEHGKSGAQARFFRHLSFERLPSAGAGFRGCGWIFGPNIVFDRGGIADCLGPPGLPGIAAGGTLRVKGVFRTGRDWMYLNRSGSACDISDIAYRRDSRAEVIVPEGASIDWDRLEIGILDCLK